MLGKPVAEILSCWNVTHDYTTIAQQILQYQENTFLHRKVKITYRYIEHSCLIGRRRGNIGLERIVFGQMLTFNYWANLQIDRCGIQNRRQLFMKIAADGSKSIYIIGLEMPLQSNRQPSSRRSFPVQQC